jgi:hypothetical protein
LHLPHSIHLFSDGRILINEILVGNFMTSETGHIILQKARFFLNIIANNTPIA